jgi:protein-S-isoprenylcysteine O-methyltransferase Ste14
MKTPQDVHASNGPSLAAVTLALLLPFTTTVLIPIWLLSSYTAYFMLKEEPDLQRKFGQEYTLYTRTVNRWLPRAPRSTGGS